MMVHRLKIAHGSLGGMQQEGWWRDITTRLIHEVYEENRGEFKPEQVEIRLNDFLSSNDARLAGNFVEFKTEEARMAFVLRYC